MASMDKLRALHTILWHARDEAGNKRLKGKLTEAISIVEDLIKGTEAAAKLVEMLKGGNTR